MNGMPLSDAMIASAPRDRPKPSPQQREMMKRMDTGQDPRALGAETVSHEGLWVNDEQLKRITVPTLVVYGGQDHPEVYEAAKTRLTNLQFKRSKEQAMGQQCRALSSLQHSRVSQPASAARRSEFAGCRRGYAIGPSTYLFDLRVRTLDDPELMNCHDKMRDGLPQVSTFVPLWVEGAMESAFLSLSYGQSEVADELHAFHRGVRFEKTCIGNDFCSRFVCRCTGAFTESERPGL